MFRERERARENAVGELAKPDRGLSVFLLATILTALLASGCVGATGGGSNSSLTTDPSSVSFGDVATGESSTRSVTVTNASVSDVSVSNVSISGPGLSASGVPAGLVLASGESAVLDVTFAPASAGDVSGNVVVWEKPVLSAAAVAVTIPVSGNGINGTEGHSVTLTWNASPSGVAGYRAYRSSASGGPYTSLNSAPISQLRWTDSTVKSDTTYYYVVTSVAADSAESDYSNQVSADIPKP